MQKGAQKRRPIQVEKELPFRDEAVREISATRGVMEELLEFFRSRNILYFLTWRDILVRYKQTLFGILWALFRPLVSMVIFTLVLGKVARLPSEAPYALLVLSGLLPWMLFSNIVQQGAESIVTNVNLVSKVYFNRFVIPVSTSIALLVDTLLSLVVLTVFMLFYRFVPDWHLIFLPLFVILGMLLSLALAVLLSAINVFYRDFRQVVPFLLQGGMFLSPVGFSSNIVDPKWHFVYALNPMVGIIDGYRWCLIRAHSDTLKFDSLISLAYAVGFMILAIWVFRRMQDLFADSI